MKIGDTRNYWTVTEIISKGRIKVKCKCGTEREMYKAHFKGNATISCGCHNNESGTKRIIDYINNSDVGAQFDVVILREKISVEKKLASKVLAQLYEKGVIDRVAKQGKEKLHKSWFMYFKPNPKYKQLHHDFLYGGIYKLNNEARGL